LKAVYPPRTRYSFIVGYDTLVRIFDPRHYTDMHVELDSLFNQCHFITANRKEHDVVSIEQFLADSARKRYAGGIDMIELSHFYAEISSTAIRDYLLRGDPVAHLVPVAIHECIQATRAHSHNDE